MAKIVFYECFRCAGKTLEEHQEKFKGKVRLCVTGYCDTCDKTVGYACELYPKEFEFVKGLNHKLVVNKYNEITKMISQERKIHD